MLTRDQILGAQDRKKQSVNVPEWGGEVLVSVMSGTDRDAYEASLIVDRKVSLANARAKLVAFCVVDESGVRLFSEDDIQALGGKSGAALDRVAKVAARLNRLSDSDLEELTGN